MSQLFQFLLYNSAGTRTGRATWVYFGVLIAGSIIGEQLHSETFTMVVVLLSPLVLLLNRLDRSGPTREELDAQLAQRTAEREHANSLKRETTWSYRLGRWVGRRPVLRQAIDAVPWVPLKRILLLVLVIFVVYSAYFKPTKTNGMYLQEIIDTHTLEKTASGLIAKLKASPETTNYSEAAWKDMEEGLSRCLVAKAAEYAASGDPYLKARANMETPTVLANRFLKGCGAI